MSTEATVQVTNESVDAAGVSLVTSTRTVVRPRYGAIYAPPGPAAGVPVWFHRLQDGRYVALYGHHWTDAVLSGSTTSGPQLYSSFTASDDPILVVTNPTTGASDSAVTVPSNMTGVRALRSAVSSREYLFLLSSLDDQGLVQFFRVTYAGSLILQGEELVPLNFSLGLSVSGAHLYVYGADTGGHLARVRKSWGRIGTNADADRQWEYDAGTGWLKDPTSAAPLPGNLPADGPCSVADLGDRTMLMTTVHSGGVWHGQAYTARAVDKSWTPVGDPIPLGTDATYLSGGVYLQPQLPVNPAYANPTQTRQVPYVTSVRVDVDTRSAILTEWSTVSV